MLTLAWPLILANITVPLMGLVDTLVLGHLESSVYLGAVAIASNIFGLVYVSFNFLRTSSVGLTAQAFGKQDRVAQQKVLFQGLIIAAFLGSVLILLSPVLIPNLLKLMMASEAVYSQALIYANIRIFSAPAVLIVYVIIGWLIGLQKTRGPLLILTLTNLVNIIFDILLVSVFNFNVKGAAFASVIADYCGLLCALILVFNFLSAQELNIFKLKLDRLFNKKELRKIIAINGHLFIRTLALLSVFAFFTAQGARLGDNILAANAILLNFLFLISNTLDGFANAAETSTGEAWGLKNKNLFYRQCLASFIWFLLITFLLMLVFYGGGGTLIALLTNIDSVRNSAIDYLPWLILMPLVSSWSYLFDGIFTGTTAMKEMRNTILFPGLLFYLPGCWIFQFLGNHGLWLAMLLFMASRSLWGLYYFRQYSDHPQWSE